MYIKDCTLGQLKRERGYFDQSELEDLSIKQRIHEKLHRDPVCNMEVSYKTAAELFTYESKIYLFCCRGCREAFAADPEKYIKHHRQHGMKRR